MDNNFGLVVYEVTGTYADKLNLTGKPKQIAEGIEAGDITAEATLTQEGYLIGKWESSLGTGGTFNAFPHDITPPDTDSKKPAIPEQVHNKYKQVGSIRLFLEDIKLLFEQIKQDFSATSKLIVTYNIHGNEVTKYSDDFLKDIRSLNKFAYFKINIQEIEAYGINRAVVVELRAHGSNDIRIQGVQESWVIGKAEKLAIFLKQYESAPVTTYKKYGPLLNQMIFWSMLVIMPSIASWQDRIGFALSIVIILQFLFWFHSKFIPNASISVSEKKPNWLLRNWPTAASWIMSIVASLIASFVFYWVVGK